MSSTDSLHVKIVVVGDGSVGKTCLLYSYSGQPFDAKHVPTIIDDYTTDITFAQKKVLLTLWDTAGQEEFDRIRVLSYPHTDLFLLCFSVVDDVSLQNIRDHWLTEIKHYSPKTPYILVGNKIDLRGKGKSGANRKEVSYEYGVETKATTLALAYFECSALSNTGVKAIFDFAVKHLVTAKIKPPRQHCVLF